MLIPEETCIFYCTEYDPKAKASHVLNRSIFFFKLCVREECISKVPSLRM